MASIKALLLRYKHSIRWKQQLLVTKNHLMSSQSYFKIRLLLANILWLHKLLLVSVNIVATSTQLKLYFNFFSFLNKKLSRVKPKASLLLSFRSQINIKRKRRKLNKKQMGLVNAQYLNQRWLKALVSSGLLSSSRELSFKLLVAQNANIFKKSLHQGPVAGLRAYPASAKERIGSRRRTRTNLIMAKGQHELVSVAKSGKPGFAYLANWLTTSTLSSYLGAKTRRNAHITFKTLDKHRPKSVKGRPRKPLKRPAKTNTSVYKNNCARIILSRTARRFATQGAFIKKPTLPLIRRNDQLRRLKHQYLILSIGKVFSPILALPVVLRGQNVLSLTTRTLIKQYKSQVLWSLPFQYVRRLFFVKDLVTVVVATTLLRSSKLLSFYLARLLEKLPKHTWFFHIFNRVMSVFRFYCRAPISLKILIRGRINKKLRKKSVCVLRTQVALSTLDCAVDYSLTHSYTSASVLGIKVWVVSNSKSARSKTFSQRYKTY